MQWIYAASRVAPLRYSSFMVHCTVLPLKLAVKHTSKCSFVPCGDFPSVHSLEILVHQISTQTGHLAFQAQESNSKRLEPCYYWGSFSLLCSFCKWVSRGRLPFYSLPHTSCTMYMDSLEMVSEMLSKHIQGVFFDWSPLNLAKSQSLYEIPYSNFFSRILLLVLGLSQI